MPLNKCPEIDGGALREARKRAELSQQALGRLCGEKYMAPMAGRNIGLIETGAHNPTPPRRAVLELVLGLPIGGLLKPPAPQQDIPRATPTPKRAAAA
jgi:hypothetical protein